MKEPRWIARRSLLFLHSESIAEHGGLPGIRDEGLLDSGLARAQNHFGYKEKCDLADLAAAYTFGLSQNHPFQDGNKRIALLATALFLELNGMEFAPDPVSAVQMMFALAARKTGEKELAQWIRQNARRIPRTGP